MIKRNRLMDRVGLAWWTRPARPGDRWRLQPAVLALEDRQLLATITVTNTNASGSGSLAAAIATANTNAQANTINFDPSVFATPQTIVLGGSPSSVQGRRRTTDDRGPGGRRDDQCSGQEPGLRD